MRIDRLDLLAYGHHRDACLDLSQPEAGLTVVCGPNEAGKSTAMRALLSALFGFPSPAQDAYMYGRSGLRVGARLAGADERELVFVRQGLTRSPLLDGEGNPLGQRELEDFLGGVSREFYVRLFSVDHDELRTHSDDLLDAGGEIGRLVFRATLGSGSVTGVLRRLDDRAGELYKDGGRAQRVTLALNRHREGMKRAREERVRSREWDRRQKAVADSEQKVAALRKSLGEARVDHSRLSRALNALPLIARRAELDLQLRSVEADGTITSTDWVERASGAQQRFEAARHGHETASANKETLERRIAEIEVSGDLVEQAAQIDKLVQGVDRYAKDAEDLGERRGQLEEARKQLSLFLGQLGLESDDGRLVAETELTTVEDLAQGYTALEAGLAGARSELSKLDATIDTERRRLEELSEPPDVAALSRAVALGSPVVPHEQALPAERETIAGLKSGAATQAGRLGLGTRAFSEIEALLVPSGQQINEEQGRRQALATRQSQLDEDESEQATERDRLESQIASILAKPGVPDPDRMHAARQHRDAGWQLVRNVLESGASDEEAVAAWAGSDPLPVAFEGAVEEADAAADDRYEHAADLTSVSQLCTRLREVSTAEQKLAERRALLEEDTAKGLEAWNQMWARAEIEAREPTEMTAWREGHHNLISTIGEIGNKERFLKSEEETIAAHVEVLRFAISELGLSPDSTRLQHLVAQADEIVAEARDRAETRRAVESDLRRALASLPDREKAVTAQQAALDAWEDSWAAVLAPLALAPAIRPNAALRAVRAHRGLPGARQEVRGFEVRIRGIERDLEHFSSRVHDVATALIEVAGRAPLDIVEDLRNTLAAARQAVTARDTFESQLDEAREALRSTKLDLDNAENDLARLRSEIELPDDAQVSPVIDRSRNAADLKRQINQIETNLLAQGAGRWLNEILAEVAAIGMDGDELGAAIATLEDDIAGLDSELGEANQRLGEVIKDLESVTAASTAADLEQDAQQELASAAVYAAEYARSAVGAAVLRKVIADYGERHRAPMLSRAGEIFSRLTVGAFTELVPEVLGEKQILLARRRNDELCTTAELSDGARDQLYLALRLAGIEYQLEHLAEPLPVVFDDVLVNFDDERSAAAISVLADLGQRTQVLLFTHHEGVVETAKTMLSPYHLGVVRLEARDHGLPLVAVGRADELVVDLSPRRKENDPSSAQAVLDALRNAGRSLSKAELVPRSGIAEAIWPQLIRSLLDRGAVVQEGQKRGAKYRLPR
jgi:uncharacterized protein YhaN